MKERIEAAAIVLEEAQKAAEKTYTEACDKAERERYWAALRVDEQDRMRKNAAYSESVLRVGAMLDAKYYEVAEASSKILSEELDKINKAKEVTLAIAKREYAKAMAEAYAAYYNSLVDIK